MQKATRKMKKRRRRRRKIERNRSKESCVLITQFHVLSVRSTSPAFVEAERSQLYHLRGATGSVIQRIVSDLFATQRSSSEPGARIARLSLISRSRYLHSGKYPTHPLRRIRRIGNAYLAASHRESTTRKQYRTLEVAVIFA